MELTLFENTSNSSNPHNRFSSHFCKFLTSIPLLIGSYLYKTLIQKSHLSGIIPSPLVTTDGSYYDFYEGDNLLGTKMVI